MDVPITTAAGKAVSANQGSDSPLDGARHRLELSTHLQKRKVSKPSDRIHRAECLREKEPL